jgi:hypothetical protein
LSREEEVRDCMTMAKGIVKYLDPPCLSEAVVKNINRLQELGELNWKEFYGWVKIENPAWLPILQCKRLVSFPVKLKLLLRAVYRLLFP